MPFTEVENPKNSEVLRPQLASNAICPACFMAFRRVKALSSRSFATRFSIRKSVGEVATASTGGHSLSRGCCMLGGWRACFSTCFNYSLCSLCASGPYCRHFLVSLCRVCQTSGVRLLPTKRIPKQFLPNRCCFLSGSSSYRFRGKC